MVDELKSIVLELIAGKYSVSQAIELAFLKLSNEPNSEFKQWLNSEINGYDGPSSVPEYRKIDCSVIAQLRDSLGRASEKNVAVTHINKWLKDNGVGMMMDKMYVSQGVRSFEETLSTNRGGNITMAIPQDIIRYMVQCYRIRGSGGIIKGFYQQTPLIYARNVIDAIRSKFINDVLQYCSNVYTENYHTSSKMTIADMQSLPNDKTILFVSYSWDNDEHKSWVADLVDRIEATDKFYVIFDQRMKKGCSLTRFMQTAMDKSDYVLIIGTPTYLDKFNSGHGGVSYEGTIITQELLRNIDSGKFIPILREGTRESAFPTVVAGINGFDLSGNNCVEDVVKELSEDFSK